MSNPEKYRASGFARVYVQHGRFYFKVQGRNPCSSAAGSLEKRRGLLREAGINCGGSVNR
jgi:hypothetical protein